MDSHQVHIERVLKMTIKEGDEMCIRDSSNPALIPSLVNDNGEFYSSHDINHRQEDCLLYTSRQIKRT